MDRSAYGYLVTFSIEIEREVVLNHSQVVIKLTFTHSYCRLPDADGVSTKAATDALARMGFMDDDDQNHMYVPENVFEKTDYAGECTTIQVKEVIGEVESEWDVNHLLTSEGLPVWTQSTTYDYRLLANIYIPVVLPTLNHLFQMESMQRKAARNLIHQMLRVGMDHRLRVEFPNSIKWFPEVECPWSNPNRPWNHFIERYYRTVLKRKGKIPEAKLL